MTCATHCQFLSPARIHSGSALPPEIRQAQLRVPNKRRETTPIYAKGRARKTTGIKDTRKRVTIPYPTWIRRSVPAFHRRAPCIDIYRVGWMVEQRYLVFQPRAHKASGQPSHKSMANLWWWQGLR
ncbi:uncharacterized protein B0H18DRAFT_1126534 [Fomitopsis serialis]|uniref:uncharacterized protein n=1 Tax=Fomitopsis serialis TaxID=139415 RepID=UPI002007E74E|nr:uncharacterized protein B0H18DRAFT_1126534 [Neoantrodia serialis]KAH9913176.1 hypothetical protein B0H18DRAFT_1126534 [Neoantrodia serialis]